MGADLFGSFAESTCAALVIAVNMYELISWASLKFSRVVASTKSPFKASLVTKASEW
jgi:translation elongation factor EF-1alpha